jgi:hypothetical protein
VFLSDESPKAQQKLFVKNRAEGLYKKTVPKGFTFFYRFSFITFFGRFLARGVRNHHKVNK